MKITLKLLAIMMIASYGCKTLSNKTITKSNLNKNWKTTSAGLLISEKAQELTNLTKVGPFIHLADGSILTVDSNQSCISIDKGKTWKKYQLFLDPAKFDIWPGALIRTHKNVIVLSFVNALEKANWNWNQYTHDSPGAIYPTYAIRSLDGGKTWQDLQKLHDDWTGANEDMIETNEGNIVFTSMMMRHNPGRHTVVTYTSKDEGKSWIQSNVIDLGGVGNHSGVTESTLVQLQNGQLWTLMRTNWGNFWEASSDDEGLIWKNFKATKIDASAAPGMLKRLSSGRLVLVWNRYYPEDKGEYLIRGGDGNFSEVAGSWNREDLWIMFSSDDGKTWTEPQAFAKTTKKKNDLSYPTIFEEEPGELWITIRPGFASLKVKLFEKDFIEK